VSDGARVNQVNEMKGKQTVKQTHSSLSIRSKSTQLRHVVEYSIPRYIVPENQSERNDSLSRFALILLTLSHSIQSNVQSVVEGHVDIRISETVWNKSLSLSLIIKHTDIRSSERSNESSTHFLSIEDGAL
jgi:hypothetical protein